MTDRACPPWCSSTHRDDVVVGYHSAHIVTLGHATVPLKRPASGPPIWRRWRTPSTPSSSGRAVSSVADSLDHWQREDGFPSDDYFDAVAEALEAAGVALETWSREEDWEVNYSISWDAYKDGPNKWAVHGLYVSWRCSEEDEPTHEDDFTGPGWYWVPYSRPGTALGDFAKEVDDLPYLAEPEQVAAAVAALVEPPS